MSKNKLLLLALSGVRIQDPELLALGLTLPGFAERAGRIARLPSLGLLTLAGRVPPGIEVAYREVDVLGGPADMLALADELAESEFGLIALSVLSARVLEAYRLADLLRERQVQVVLGGLHVSALPNEAARHADAVVVGEAEAVWPRLLEDWLVGRLAPRYKATASEAARAWRETTLPRFDLSADSRRPHDRLTLQTMRGCPLDCRFCGASRTISPYRTKPIALVESELDCILSTFDGAAVELADDNTFVDKRRGRELAGLLGRKRVRWFTETDLSVADDSELLDSIAQSRCAGLLIGLEAPSARTLARIDSREWKAGQVEAHAEKVARIQSRGIPVTGCFVLGFDAQGPEDFETTFEAARALDLAEVQVTLLTPFPGTELFEELRRERRLHPEPFWDRCTLFDVCFQPARMAGEELRARFHELVRELYAPEETARRKRRFEQCVSDSWRARRGGPVSARS